MRLLVLLLFGSFLTGLAARPEKPVDPIAIPRPVYKNPLDVLVDDDGKTARVVLTGPRTVAVVDLATGKIKEEKPWPKDKPMPEASDVADITDYVDGRRQFPKWRPENYENLAGSVPSSISNIRGSYSLSEFNIKVWVMAHQRPRSNLPTTQVAQGWVFANSISLWLSDYALEPGDKRAPILGGMRPLQYITVLDQPGKGYADPTAVVVTSDVKRIFVSSAGGDAVLAIDMTKLKKYVIGQHEHVGIHYFFRDPNKPELYKDEATDDLTGHRQFVQRVLETQANPRRLGLSKDGKTLVVSNYLGDSLTVIDAEKLKVVKHIPLGGPKPDAARRGEILFNSSKLTFQGQFTCASCHPNGGSDGLNWDLTRDGIGNPKNTKALWGVKDTGPYGWLGTSPTLEDRIRGTLRTLHRYEPSDAEVSDLVAYLATLEPPPRPEMLIAGIAELLPEETMRVRETENRGKVIFETKGRCASCHREPTFQDGKQHNIGTGTISGEDRFNTPSLRALNRTAPYLHDGRAATLEDVFKKHDPEQRHGAGRELSVEELADLIAYLKSL